MPDKHRFTTNARNIGTEGKLQWGGEDGWESEIEEKSGVSVESGTVSPVRIPTDGLVAHWKLDGDATDSAGGYDGSTHGATYVSDDDRGTVASFDGSGDYVDTTLQSASTPFTFAVWVNPADTNYGSIWDNYANTTSDIEFTHDTELTAYANGYGMPAVTISSFETGVWQLTTLVITDTEVRVYLDTTRYSGGSSSGTSSFDSGQPYYLGSYPGSDGGSGDGQFYAGKMSDALYYDRALSDAEVSDLYDATK